MKSMCSVTSSEACHPQSRAASPQVLDSIMQRTNVLQGSDDASCWAVGMINEGCQSSLPGSREGYMHEGSLFPHFLRGQAI